VGLNDLILAEGDEARRLNEKKTSNTKVRFLKKGAAFRGHFLTTKFVTFAQHGDFEKKIQSHACLDPKGRTNCPSCKAGVKRTTKTLVFWFDVDAREIVVRDVAKSAMPSLYDFIDAYGDDALTTIAKVSLGEKGAVNVLPVPVKKGETIELAPSDVVVDEDLLSYVMGVRTADEILALIAGKTDAAPTDDNVEIKAVGEGQLPHDKF
jgi:hypothetical protein